MEGVAVCFGCLLWAVVAIDAGGQVGTRPGHVDNVENLIDGLKDRNDLIRCQSAEALGSIKDPRAVEPLILALNDNDAGVRAWAAHALGKKGDPRAVTALIAVLTDNDPSVRESVVVALGKLRDPRAIEALIDALEKHSGLRAWVLWALGEIPDWRAGEVLLNSVNQHGSSIRESVIATDAQAAGAVCALAKDPAEAITIRAAAVAGIAKSLPECVRQVSTDDRLVDRFYETFVIAGVTGRELPGRS